MAPRKEDIRRDGSGDWTRGDRAQRDHPIQNFWWVDLDAEPEHNYTYTVVPRYGTPTTLTSGPSGASVTVVTEAESGDLSIHSVFFNRGAVASQEYVRDFGDVLPRNLQGHLQEAAFTDFSRTDFRRRSKRFLARADFSDPFFCMEPCTSSTGCPCSRRSASLAVVERTYPSSIHGINPG